MHGRSLSAALQRSALLILLLVSGGWCAQPPDAIAWVGRPLGEALNALRSVDFAVIFSSELVSSGLRVRAEPTARDAPGMAREMLRPYGLTLRAISPGVYAVVTLESKPTAPPTQPARSKPPAATVSLEEIVVAASQYHIDNLDSGAYRLGAGELDAQPRVADDPLRAVARLPGITGNGLSARLNVRGGDVDEVRLLIDGFPIRQPFHLSGFQSLFSVLDAALVSKMDVYTGGFPARYGDRMSGVIDAGTRSPLDQPQHSIGLSSFHVNLRTAGVLSAAHHLDGLISARSGVVRSWLDQLGPNNPVPNYSDGQAKLRWQPGATTTVAAQLLWSRDRLVISDPDRGEDASIASQAHYFWLRADHSFAGRWRASAWLGNTVSAAQRSGRIVNPEVVAGAVNEERRADLWDLRTAFYADFGPRRHLELGMDWQVGDGDYSYQSQALFPQSVATAYRIAGSTVRDLTLAPFRRDVAVYGSYRFRTGDSLTSEVGLRVQRAAGLGLPGTVVFDPRLSVSKQLSDRTQLRFSWGRFHQLDEVQELRVEDGARSYASPQRSEHLIVGMEHRMSERLVWRAELFRKTQQDPRPRFENQLNPLAILAELAPDRRLVSPLRAEIHGVEWSAVLAAKPWTWRFGYSWSQALDELTSGDVPRNWDQTHSFNASAEWQRQRWSAVAAVTLHTGWPTTALTAGTAGSFTVGARNDARWPWFRSLDLHVSYTLPLRMGELVTALDVANALNMRNRCCAELSAGATALPDGIAIEPLTWIQRVPSLGIRWDF